MNHIYLLIFFLLHISLNAYSSKPEEPCVTALESIQTSFSGQSWTIVEVTRKSKSDPGYDPTHTIHFQRTHRNRELINTFLCPYPIARNLLTTDNLKKSQILDIGCGGGYFVQELIDIGVDIVGLDIKLSDELKSLPHGQTHFIEADMRQIPLKDNSFDLVTSFFSLLTYYDAREFEIDPKEVTLGWKESLQEIYRILKPGGYAIIGPIHSLPTRLVLDWVSESNLNLAKPFRGHETVKSEFIEDYISTDILVLQKSLP